MDTLVLLDGGHSTYVRDVTPQQIEHDITSLRQGSGHQFIYLQSDDKPDNGIVIDLDKIVALIAHVR